jgi:divinyl chlorophyllide a 8-vinyl-reductase
MASHAGRPDPAAAQQHVDELRELVFGDSPVRDTYPTGARGESDGEHVLVLGATGYIGRALVPELAARGFVPVVVTRDTASAQGIHDTLVVVADPVVEGSLEQAFAAYPISVVVSLLSSRRPNDPDECRRVDYDAVTNAARTSAAHGVRRFVHVSDYGVYRPELLPQVFKLQVEGELLGGHYGELPWTVVRPTAYFPYLSVNFGTVKNGEPYRIFDHGEYAICNPIARQDLAEFLVNAILDDDAERRILPVGGPWTRDNVVSIKSAGDLMFEVLGTEPSFTVETLEHWDRTITRMRRAGSVYPKMRNVAFYLEAAKYWSTVTHLAPPYGTRTLRGFFEQLKDREYPAGSFRDRMKAGTAMIPTDI